MSSEAMDEERGQHPPEAPALRSANPAIGRGVNGRFAPGNPGGPGNPMAARVAEYRQQLLQCVQPGDVEAIYASMLFKAKQGDTAAAGLLLDRLLGKATHLVEVQSEAAQPKQMIAILNNPRWLTLVNELAKQLEEES